MALELDSAPQTTSSMLDYAPSCVFRYIANEYECDNALRRVHGGEIGMDTEFCDPPFDAIVTAAVAGIIEWDSIKLCLLQLALGDRVLVIDIKRMRTFPLQVERVLDSPHIAKVGVGLVSDGKVLWDGVRATVQNLVDVGLMTKLSNPERYKELDQGPLSLEACVQDLLHRRLDKELQQSDWATEITPLHIKYAGLDAQASLEVYKLAKVALKKKSDDLSIEIPLEWYNFDVREGCPVRRMQTIDGEYLPWSPRFCPWYARGKFQGYFK
ncbi:ribonuclease H-like domain-containing protein [Mycena polygramma]|nr:ribonuclease H-like domain-containing protein [Mycena polygramma]KAJ7626392.1 ribonuclease H-like domain-containing protein [Mycena polygramma]